MSKHSTNFLPALLHHHHHHHHHHDIGTNIPNPDQYYPTPAHHDHFLMNNILDNNYFMNLHSGIELSHHLDYLEVDHDQQPPSFISSTSTANVFEASNNNSTSSLFSVPFVSSQSLFSTTHEMSSTTTGSSAGSFDGGMPLLDNHNNMQEEFMRDQKRAKVEGHVVAIRTQTELETLDDGFKWRKYGKKMVKSNPNPRHYYKCTIGGCKVKKRVERDGEDSSYLVTTYNGRHNHESPCVVYNCDQLPFLVLRPSQ